MADRKDDIFALVPQNEYDNLICRIDNRWTQAKNRAVEAVNTELLDANWQTGRYIVEFEQKGRIRAEYGQILITRQPTLFGSLSIISTQEGGITGPTRQGAQ